MAIYDCFQYFNEDHIVDLRLNILDPYVDYFVISESTKTHQGKNKKINFDINNFPKFKDKIQYLVIENEPEGIDKNNNSSAVKRMNSLLRINQSYDYMMNAIKDASDNDLICLSDNDEIPNFDSEVFKNSNKDIFIFKQLFFYYKFNLFYDLMPWYGTKACKKKKLVSLSWLRNLKNKRYPLWRLDTLFSKTKQTNLQIVENGGWHFTNLKTAEEIHTKLSNFGHHNEFDVSGVTVKDIQECIDNRIVNYNHQADQSADNKYTANYKLQLIEDKILPKYLISNKQNLKEWFD